MSNLKIKVGLGSCGIAAGADEIYNTLNDIQSEYLFDLTKTGCIGMCYNEPLVELIHNNNSYLYGNIDKSTIKKIVEMHINKNSAVNKYLIKSSTDKTQKSNYFETQFKIALRNCGVINPEDINDYKKNNGYKAVESILKNNISSSQIIKIIEESNLRGRGGGGFKTGTKWSFAYNTRSSQKYVICNADEGDPGAFMDRSLLEGDPHSVIEGMMIAALAIGADKAFIYVRSEYPLAIKRLKIAIEQATNDNIIGKNIFNTNKNFELNIFKGAGAFVCGEETALINSIEGKRGTPDNRPPYPTSKGLYGKPSLVNNVETFANVPWIIFNGAKEYLKYGTNNNSGTKVFAIAGKVNRVGLIEVPMGISINEIVFNIGGGIPDGKNFKAIQLGGPSGGCLPAEYGNTKVDFDSLNHSGAIMGSGGMIIMDDSTCMVDIAKYFLNFTKEESCGDCTPCRYGTVQMLSILNDIIDGKGKEQDIELLLNIANNIKKSSLCGLGQTAPNPVITTIKYFREEYLEHVNEKKCRAKKCKALISYYIDKKKCTGCHLCFKNCPHNAIKGKAKEKHEIIQEKCTKCGICIEKCPDKFKAVVCVPGQL